MKNLYCICLLLACLCFTGNASATDQNRTVMDVILVDTNGDLDGFLDRMKRIQDLAVRLNIPAKLRVFQNTFAADKNGDVFLYWELPSFVAFAEAETAIHDDAEFLVILEELDAAGQSFKSELLSIEITRQ